jgi:AraC-like DNA-binding protein
MKSFSGKLSDQSPFLSKQVDSSRLFFCDDDDTNDFSVKCGGLERCRPDYRIDRKDFPWFLLEFVLSGRGQVTLDNIATPLKPGVFFLYGPGIEHCIVSDSDEPLVKYFVGFSGAAASRFLKRFHLVPSMVSQCLETEPIRRAFDTLIERGARNSSHAPSICALIVQQLLLMCKEGAVDSGSTETRAYETFNRAKQCIENGYLQFDTLEAVATTCKIDAPYLCRLFARFHDESPYQFLIRLRMQHAAMLLLEGIQQVKDIALACGYTDHFHFSRVFKSVHRVAPSHFRVAMHAKQSRIPPTLAHHHTKRVQASFSTLEKT